jgi:ABC-2 type transport system permease protein
VTHDLDSLVGVEPAVPDLLAGCVTDGHHRGDEPRGWQGFVEVPGRLAPLDQLPGTLAMTMVLLTMYSGVGLNADVTAGVSDRFRSMPIWRAAPVVGSLVGDVARYLVAAVLVLALGLALGFRPAGGAVGVALGVGLALVFALSLSWLWTALGLVLRTPNAVMSAGFVIQFPLAMASNVFADPATMPGWLRAFVDINPMSHLVSAERALMAGADASGEVRWVLLASVVLVLVFAPLTAHLYRRKE